MSIIVRHVNIINQIDAEEWNSISPEMPFQSHAWHRFGEKVMEDCLPIYLLAYQDGALLGRAVFWVTRNEPLPRSVGNLRTFLDAALFRYPLLICRSPIAQTSGLVIARNVENPKEVATALIEAALTHGRQHHCSILVLDYLSREQKTYLPPELFSMESPDPGHILCNEWTDFHQYLSRGDKKARRHYNRTLRELEGIQVNIQPCKQAEQIDEILPLIRNVERQHGAPSNPWMKPLLENMSMVDGTLLTATAAGHPVGSLLLLEDGPGQIATAFGRDQDLPYVYLGLFYEGIHTAMDHKVKVLRWGSGANEWKRRMGFKPEDNGVIAFTLIQPFTRRVFNRIMPLFWR